MGCCNQPGGDQLPPSPSVGQMAQSFGQAIARFAYGGFQPSSPELTAARLAVCAECPRASPGGAICTACGCILEIKARMPAEYCPLGRWPLL